MSNHSHRPHDDINPFGTLLTIFLGACLVWPVLLVVVVILVILFFRTRRRHK